MLKHKKTLVYITSLEKSRSSPLKVFRKKEFLLSSLEKNPEAVVQRCSVKNSQILQENT